MKGRIVKFLTVAMVAFAAHFASGYYAWVTITFSKGGGSGGTDSITVAQGDLLPSITVPTRTGYTFDGYCSDFTAEESTRVYLASGRSAFHATYSMTLFAIWTANKYTVSLDRQDGSGGASSVTATYDSMMPSITVPTRAGYTFGGYWTGKNGSGTQYYTASGSSARKWDGTRATTLYAKWMETHVVTLDLQGGGDGTLSVMAICGITMPSITVPVRTGYGFGGYWTGTNGDGIQYYTMLGESARKWDGTRATTLYAKWVAPSAITLDQQGGNGGTSNLTAAYGSEMPSITTPIRSGYTFGGYFSSAGGVGTQYYTEAGDSAMLWDGECATTLYAKWWCSLTLDQQGGNGGTTNVIAIFNGPMPSITVPTRTGYGFGGYWTGANGSGKQYYTMFGDSARNWDGECATTLYAKWVAPSAVTLDRQGGSGGTSIVTAEYGSDMPSIAIPSRSGYTFGGYFSSVGGNGTQYYNELGESVSPWDRESATTLYAKWGYRVTLDRQGGDGGTTSVVAAYEGKMPKISVPKRAGYTFCGYWSDKNGAETQYYTASGASAHKWDMVNAATLYAKWQVNKYTVTFDANGGTGGMTVTQDYGTELSAPTVTHEHAILIGWEPDFTGTVPASDTVYVAQWRYYWETAVNSDGTLSINGVNFWPDGVDQDGVCKIPSMIDGRTVTVIASGAFKDCINIRSIAIPNSVTNIGVGAFSGCSGLEEITLPFVGARRGNAGSSDSLFGYIFGSSSYTGGKYTCQYCSSSGSSYRFYFYIPSNLKKVVVTDETVLGYGAFYGCSDLTSVTILDSVRSIGHYAFSNCSSLTSVAIPGSVTSIGVCAFEGCSGLTSVTIPDSVTSIGGYAFDGCSGLTSVSIPASVTSIESRVFLHCSGLMSVSIPDSVTSIGSSAFYGCSGLASVTIPNSVTNIGSGAFYNCSGLTSVTIPNSVTKLESYAFSGCSALTSVTIPDSVTSIGSYAFDGCSGLTSVHITDLAKWCGIAFYDNTANPLYYAHNLYLNSAKVTDLVMPAGVTSIGSYAFDGCSGLTSVTIPDSVTRIGSYAFDGCSGLTIVTIPDNVTSIGSSAFSGCSELRDVTVPQSVCNMSMGMSSVFPSAYQSITNLVISCSVTSIGERAFSSCRGLASVTIPDSVESIGNSAFFGCSGLTSVTIPDSVKSIGNYTFSGCSGLTSVTIPNSVTSIGDYAFYNCSGLTIMAIPNSVTRIGASAFSGCSGLTSVTIPDSVMNICEGTFSGCGGIMEIILPFVGSCRGNTGSADSLFGYIFGTSYYPGSEEIRQYYSESSYAYYHIPLNLRNVVITDETVLGYGAFCNCSGLTNVTIPVGVTSVGDWAFYGCSALSSVTIPSSVTSVGASAFSGCDSIANINVSPGDSNRIRGLVADSELSLDGVNFIDVAYIAFEANGGSSDEAGRSVTLGSLLGGLPEPTRLGYAFAGWWTSPDGGTQIAATTVVTGNMTCYAHWLANKYTVTFDANGGAGGKSVTLDCGSALAAPTVTRDGYTFAGWSPSVPATVPAANVTYTAQWKVNQYKVTFDANGGTGGKTVTQDYGTALAAPSVSCTGYTFTGWSPSVPSTVPAGNVTYTAQWKVNQYTVTFDANGGTGGKTVTQNYGTTLAAPTVTRAGYTFAGWSPNVPTTVPAANVTYTAQWKVNQYKVTFDANGGMVGGIEGGMLATNGWKLESMDDVTEEYQSASIGNSASTSMSLTLAGPYDLTFSWKVSSESGYDYLRWYLDGTEKAKISGTGGTWQNVSVSVPSGEHTIRWTYSKDYSRSSGSDCGWVRVPKIGTLWSRNYGEAVGTLPTPTREGYTFAGWWTAANGGTQVSENSKVTSSVTYYARWSAYTVRFNKNDGSGATKDQTFNVGETKSLLWKDSQLGWSRSGYTFKGWAESASGAVKYANGETVKDIASAGATKNLYAIWQANQSTYTVRFNKNDGSGATKDQSFKVGDTKSLLWKDSELKWSRDGYTFKGWAESASGSVKYANGEKVKDIASAGATKNLYAIWQSNQSTYTVRFNKNDGSGATKDQTFKVGETKSLLWKDSELKWSRDGYTFKGWAESASGAVKYANGEKVKDIASAGATKNLYAIWQSNQATYTVRFHKYDGSGATADQVFKVGETKSLLWKDSELKWSRDGYTFVGWVPWDPDGKNCILCKYANGEKVKDLGKAGEVVHLYAGWKSSYRYQVCFNKNDGTGATMTQVMLRDKDVGLAWKDSQIGWTRAGYSFRGWAESASGAVKYANGATVRNLAAANATKQLYAVWTKADSVSAAPRVMAAAVAAPEAVVPEWAVGTFYGWDEESFATITVSADGDVMGIVLFEDDTWTIEGVAEGVCIDAEVVDEAGKSRPMVFWLSLDDDGHVVLESEDGSIRVMD